MNEALIYLFKVLMLQGIFFLFYLCITKRSGRHALNRYFLLFSLILSFSIPFIKLTSPVNQVFESSSPKIIEWIDQPIQTFNEIELIPVQESASFSPWRFIPYLFYLISTVLLVRSIFYISILYSIKRTSKRIPREWYTLFKTTHDRPFSFFSNVFMPGSLFGSDSFGQILMHECVHVKQLHSYDRLLMDFLVSLFWFNPFIYLYRNALIEIHEYQADEAVIVHFNDPVGYQETLFSQLQTQRYSGLVSHFNVELIKKRIVMMNRKSKMTPWLYALVVPITMPLLFAFSGSNTMAPLEEVSTKITDLIEPIDSYHQLVQEQTSEEAVPSILPIKNPQHVRLTSAYGMRLHPVLKVEKMHLGTDFSCKEGSEIIASADGIIELIGTQSDGYGNQIVIDHGNGFKTRYAQLSVFKVKQGDAVKKGQLIALSGNSGASTAPHLHYEVQNGDRRVNPMNYIHDFKPKPVDKKLGQQEKELKKELLLAEQERLKAETEALKVRKEKEITYNQKELAEQQKQMAQSQKLLAEKERKLAIEAEEKREIKRVKEDLEKELAKLDDKNPLYVVDGKVVKKVKDLNPDQIQKISIVKGAKAIDTYGPEGSDGVVVIETKSKIKDKSKKKSKSSKSDKE